MQFLQKKIEDKRFLRLIQAMLKAGYLEDWTFHMRLLRRPSRLNLHACHNVAKKVVEFEYQEEIPRSRLRAVYGDAFKGAPLRCQLSGEGTIAQDAYACLIPTAHRCLKQTQPTVQPEQPRTERKAQ